jgi:hypothetical protein
MSGNSTRPEKFQPLSSETFPSSARLDAAEDETRRAFGLWVRTTGPSMAEMQKRIALLALELTKTAKAASRTGEG